MYKTFLFFGQFHVFNNLKKNKKNIYKNNKIIDMIAVLHPNFVRIILITNSCGCIIFGRDIESCNKLQISFCK